MEWEKYQPVELYAMDEAQQWIREQNAIAIANAVGRAVLRVRYQSCTRSKIARCNSAGQVVVEYPIVESTL